MFSFFFKLFCSSLQTSDTKLLLFQAAAELAVFAHHHSTSLRFLAASGLVVIGCSLVFLSPFLFVYYWIAATGLWLIALPMIPIMIVGGFIILFGTIGKKCNYFLFLWVQKGDF